MKNMFESAETFEAFATIDYCYFVLGQINEEIQKSAPKSAIDALIDKATGFDKAVNPKLVSDAIEMAETIVENKKKIEADYSSDEEFLNRLRGFLSE